jgi:hypothetical protein
LPLFLSLSLSPVRPRPNPIASHGDVLMPLLKKTYLQNMLLLLLMCIYITIGLCFRRPPNLKTDCCFTHEDTSSGVYTVLKFGCLWKHKPVWSYGN